MEVIFIVGASCLLAIFLGVKLEGKWFLVYPIRVANILLVFLGMIIMLKLGGLL